MPVITSIESQKRNPDRVNVFVDYEYCTSTDLYTAKKNKLKVDQEINLEDLQKLCLEASIEKAKSYVLDYQLGKTEKMLRDKLKEKGYEEEVIQSVVDFMKKYNFLNDADYANRYAKDALFLKKYGFQKIRFMLKQKGIPDEFIKEAMNKLTYDEELEVVKKVIDSNYSKYERKAKNERDLQNKLRTFLYGRGFSGDVVSEALKIYADDIE